MKKILAFLQNSNHYKHLIGNVHIYENNLERTRLLLDGDDNVKFELNV